MSKVKLWRSFRSLSTFFHSLWLCYSVRRVVQYFNRIFSLWRGEEGGGRGVSSLSPSLQTLATNTLYKPLQLESFAQSFSQRLSSLTQNTTMVWFWTPKNCKYGYFLSNIKWHTSVNLWQIWIGKSSFRFRKTGLRVTFLYFVLILFLITRNSSL